MGGRIWDLLKGFIWNVVLDQVLVTNTIGQEFRISENHLKWLQMKVSSHFLETCWFGILLLDADHLKIFL